MFVGRSVPSNPRQCTRQKMDDGKCATVEPLTIMDRLPRAVLSLATAAWRVSFALLVLIGCSEHSPTAPVHRQMSSRLIVSAPQAQATALLASHAAQGGDGISLHNQIANDNMLVYVSLP